MGSMAKNERVKEIMNTIPGHSFSKLSKALEIYHEEQRPVREHNQGAEANKNMEYTDTAPNSALGTYNAEGITAKTEKKKLKSVLGGGGSILGG